VFWWPYLGNLQVNAAIILLSVFEALRARSHWHKLHEYVRRYCYIRGVASALGSESKFWALRRQGGSRGSKPRLATINLDEGIALDQSFEAANPDGVVIMSGGTEVGRIEAVPGAERLRWPHICSFLSSNSERWIFDVVATRALSAGFDRQQDHRIANEPACESGTVLQRQVMVGSVDIATWRFEPRLSEIAINSRLLVRRGQCPLGWVELPPPLRGGHKLPQVQQAVADQLKYPLTRDWFELQMGGSQAMPPAPGISIIVCTRDRTEQLRRCLLACS
jgi:hypothetical protein